MNRIRHYHCDPLFGPANADIVNAGHLQLGGGIGPRWHWFGQSSSNLIPGFVEQGSAVDDLGLDLQNFFVIHFGGMTPYELTIVDGPAPLDKRLERVHRCPTLLWNLVDEPGDHDAARCVRDLTTRPDRGDRPPLDALADAAREPALYASSAASPACDAALPMMLADLIDELDRHPRIRRDGLNLTGDRASDTYKHERPPDYASYTNNWVGRDPPKSWPPVQLQRREQEALQRRLLATMCLVAPGADGPQTCVISG